MSEIDEGRRRSFDASASYTTTCDRRIQMRSPMSYSRPRAAACSRSAPARARQRWCSRGASIIALEPGANLAAVLRRNVADYDVTVEHTTFEAWPIARPFDLVMAAQAIHWVDPTVRYTKAAEVLAPGGGVAVIRNEMLPFEPDLRAELETAYARWHSPSSNRPTDDLIEDTRRELVEEIGASQRFGPVETRVYPWTTTFTTARYLQLLDTYSDHAVLAPEPRARLYEAIADALALRGNSLAVTYVSMAFVARRL